MGNTDHSAQPDDADGAAAADQACLCDVCGADGDPAGRRHLGVISYEGTGGALAHNAIAEHIEPRRAALQGDLAVPDRALLVRRLAGVGNRGGVARVQDQAADIHYAHGALHADQSTAKSDDLGVDGLERARADVNVLGAHFGAGTEVGGRDVLDVGEVNRGAEAHRAYADYSRAARDAGAVERANDQVARTADERLV